METNLTQSIDMIDKLYNNLNYFDIYGGSFLLFLLISIIVITWATYFSLMVNAQAIKDDWTNQRCNPKVMPFAGFINKPDNKSITDFTAENFSYCTQAILTNITGEAVQPFQFISNFLLNIFQSFLDAINQIRSMMSQTRENIKIMAESVLHRILNTMLPLQKMFMAFMDSLYKTQAVLTASLYTSLGSYYTLKALMGAIVEMIVKMLIVLVGIIVGLWVIPITWPAAAAMSAVFLSISIPLAIIVAVMEDVLHIHSSAIPKLKCFDKFTLIPTNLGLMTIDKVKVGDIIAKNNNKILGTIKLLSENETMYHYNNVTISGSHMVLENGNWIFIKDSKQAFEIKKYDKKFIYCLITENKKIEIKDCVFTDWDENVDLLENLTYGGFSENCELITKFGDSKKIKSLEVGDILANGDVIYGIIELSPSLINDPYSIQINKQDDNQIFYGQRDYLMKKFPNERIRSSTPPSKIYHLLTTSEIIKINNVELQDYERMLVDQI